MSSIAKLDRLPEGRVFPSRATLTIYDMVSGRPAQIEVLTALQINSPSTKAELDAAFAMSLPKGVVIYDRTLGRKTTLDRPTTVEEIVSGKLPFEVVEGIKTGP